MMMVKNATKGHDFGAKNESEILLCFLTVPFLLGIFRHESNSYHYVEQCNSGATE